MLIFGDLRIDSGAGRVYKNEEEVELTAIEFKLLVYLVNNRNRVIRKEDIFKNVWDDSFVSDGTLNVHIRHLREKLEDNPNNPAYIKTARGRGYCFKAEEK